MSYQVLARKWRPRRFAEMVGQEHVVRALNNALERNRLHHAYLFSGTRGVGKTTLARIFAKSLNCERGVTAEPCGVCSSCTEIDEGRFVDLLEVDAASRTKVDQTRELLDNVPYAPVRGRYKVYLIDEVHMFSSSSFNALLKTLEEPPPHVKFLLATTDPQKVPVTVLSRCLQFNLKRLLPEQIQGQLAHILTQETVNNDAPALVLLARAADGSMRDALSLLDQAIAFGGGQVGEADVRSMLGTLSRDLILDLLQCLADANAAGLLDRVAHMAERTPDFNDLLRELLGLLHRIAVGQMAPELLAEGTDADPRERALAQSMAAEDVQLYYQIGLLGQRDLELAPDPRTGLEMVLLRMLAFRPDGAAPTSQVRKPVRTIVATASRGPTVATAADNRISEPAAPPMGGPPRLQGVDDWHGLAASLPLRGIAKQLANNCEFESWNGRRLVLRLDPGCEQMRVAAAEERLINALRQRLGVDTEVAIRVANPETETPAQREVRRREERRHEAQRSMTSDPVVQALQEGFDATLVAESIRPVDEV